MTAQGYNFGGEKAKQLAANLQARRRRLRINAFAELLAEHGDVTKAARQLGLSREQGHGLFGRIRRELGEQAR